MLAKKPMAEAITAAEIETGVERVMALHSTKSFALWLWVIERRPVVVNEKTCVIVLEAAHILPSTKLQNMTFW